MIGLLYAGLTIAAAGKEQPGNVQLSDQDTSL